MIRIDNHGPLITATDYWESEVAAAGKMIVSPNAGAIRVLIPRQLRPVLNDLRAAKYAILSRGPWDCLKPWKSSGRTTRPVLTLGTCRPNRACCGRQNRNLENSG